MIQQALNRPPANVRHKFKFNTLVSRYQAYRQLWERTLRQIDEGTYERHVFKAKLRERERGVEEPRRLADPESPNGGAASAPIQKLYGAFAAARKKTGEGMGDLTPGKLAALVRKQTSELRRQHGKGKLRFRVVVEDGRARLRATFKRA